MNIYHKIIKELFPHLKLKDPNISLGKKIYVYLSILAQLWVIATLLLYFTLPYLAKNRYTNHHLTFYTFSDANSTQAKLYFDRVSTLISKHPLYAKQEKISIYLLNNHSIYMLLNPIELLPNRQTFAFTLKNNIYINNGDTTTNKAFASSGAKENLDAIILHESVHAMQNSRYGWFYTSFKMPYWVKEGYAIYSAWNLSRYNEEKLIKDLNKTKDADITHWSIFAKDQFYALMVKQAITKMDKSVDDLHLGKVNYSEVLNSLLVEYNITQK